MRNMFSSPGPRWILWDNEGSGRFSSDWYGHGGPIQGHRRISRRVPRVLLQGAGEEGKGKSFSRTALSDQHHVLKFTWRSSRSFATYMIHQRRKQSLISLADAELMSIASASYHASKQSLRLAMSNVTNVSYYSSSRGLIGVGLAGQAR